VITALDNYSTDVAQHGCSAVYALARNEENTSKRLGAVGACEAVVDALEQHIAVAAVTEESCRAVCELACFNKSTLRALPTNTILQQALRQQVYGSPAERLVQQAINQISNKWQ
jgi:hypothetical protein